MLASFKINTALFICSAFVFKFLFLNISYAYSLNSPNTQSFSSKSSQAAVKNSTSVDASDTSKQYQYLADVCEESSDKDDHFKSNALLPVLVLYCLVSQNIEPSQEKVISSPKHFSYTSSYRYLLFRIFRI